METLVAIALGIFTGAVGLVIAYFGVLVLLESSKMIDQRKKNFRAGTHDYYGNKIENNEEQGR